MGSFDALIGHVIDLNFSSHGSMIEAALLWQLEEYQFDNGSFNGSIKAVHTSNIQIANTFRSNGIFLKGKTPQNAYLFASAESEGRMTHNGLSIFEDELVVLTENDQLDFIVSSTFRDVTIAIDKDFFDHTFQHYFNEPFQYDTINKRIQLKEKTGSSFRNVISEIMTDLMVQHTKLKNNTDFHEQAEDTILQLLFQNIDLSRQRSKALESDINANKIRKYIEINYKNAININELCTRKKLSDRTLRLGFKHLFGLAPKQYHKCYRLGKIHHALLQSDPTIDTVEKIAYDHGFYHMGRFSNSYKSMFGNTPSETLRKTSS